MMPIPLTTVLYWSTEKTKTSGSLTCPPPHRWCLQLHPGASTEGRHSTELTTVLPNQLPYLAFPSSKWQHPLAQCRKMGGFLNSSPHLPSITPLYSPPSSLSKMSSLLYPHCDCFDSGPRLLPQPLNLPPASSLTPNKPGLGVAWGERGT